MRLKYKILWIEDEKGWLEATKEFVEDVLEDYGFEPDIQTVNNQKELSENALEIATLSTYDLILVDYSLDNITQDLEGGTIIDDIRKQKIFTEIIFYSQNYRQLREFVTVNFIEGVYCVDRNRSDFEDKFEKIFKVTIKKIQSISALRGLVMSEVSELDQMNHDIIECFFESNFSTEEKQKIYQYIVGLIEKSFAQGEKKFKKNIKLGTYDALLSSGLLDSYKTARIVDKIIKTFDLDRVDNEKHFLEIFTKEVIAVRNNLAHCVEEDGILKTRKGEVTFKENDFINIRKDLKKYFDYLKNISNFKHT